MINRKANTSNYKVRKKNFDYFSRSFSLIFRYSIFKYNQGLLCFYLLDHSMDNAFFSNRVNSWLKDPKEKTEFNIKQWVRLEMKKFLNI